MFDDVQRKPWECVRGMDQSFGYNAQSRPEHFLAHDELLWMLTDIAAKGGNLLLNVGPRGVDAQIPDEQLTRLDWLGRMGRAPRDAIVGDTAVGDSRHDHHRTPPVRYTARDDTVYAFVQARPADHAPRCARHADDAVTTVDGAALPWNDTPPGIVDRPADDAAEPRADGCGAPGSRRAAGRRALPPVGAGTCAGGAVRRCGGDGAIDEHRAAQVPERRSPRPRNSAVVDRAELLAQPAQEWRRGKVRLSGFVQAAHIVMVASGSPSHASNNVITAPV